MLVKAKSATFNIFAPISTELWLLSVSRHSGLLAELRLRYYEDTVSLSGILLLHPGFYDLAMVYTPC